MALKIRPEWGALRFARLDSNGRYGQLVRLFMTLNILSVSGWTNKVSIIFAMQLRTKNTMMTMKNAETILSSKLSGA